MHISVEERDKERERGGEDRKVERESLGAREKRLGSPREREDASDSVILLHSSFTMFFFKH